MKYPVSFELELKKNPYDGIYIGLEGIDGSGKSTQVLAIADHFRSQGREVVITAEPRREGDIGLLINKILNQQLSVPTVAIQYLFAADRAQHQEELLLPELQKGKVVISDRTFWSAVPYGVLDRKILQKIETDAEQLLVAFSILSVYHQFTAPDATIYLNISVEEADTRIAKLTRNAELYEHAELLVNVKKTYDWMIEKFREEFIVVDGDRAKDEITAEIMSKISILKK